jgi:hypothetical protein
MEIYSQLKKKISVLFAVIVCVMALFSSNKSTIPNNTYKIHEDVTTRCGSAEKKGTLIIYKLI